MNNLDLIKNDKIVGPHYELLTQTKGANNTSDKYRPITTAQVLDTFLSRGFTIGAFSKIKSQKEEKRGFEKHTVTLNLPNTVNFKIDGLQPKMRIVNSFDASSSLQFYLGVYRIICSNGLVIGKGIFHERIIHIGDVQTKLNQSIDRSINAFDLVASNISNWSNIHLTGLERLKLAERLLRLRIGQPNEGFKVSFRSRELDKALRVRRDADSSNDLFTVFNRIQENILQRPNVKYIKTDLTKSTFYGFESKEMKIRKLSPIKDAEMNSKFWSETNNFVNALKVGA